VRDNPAEEQVSNRGDDTSGTNSVACFAVEGDGQLSLEAIVDSGVRCAVGLPARIRVASACSVDPAWAYPAWAYPAWTLH
jgi:hypothetical protein